MATRVARVLLVGALVGLHHLGDAEIDDAQRRVALARAHEQEVGGLHVAVGDAGLVGAGERVEGAALGAEAREEGDGGAEAEPGEAEHGGEVSAPLLGEALVAPQGGRARGVGGDVHEAAPGLSTRTAGRDKGARGVGSSKSVAHPREETSRAVPREERGEVRAPRVVGRVPPVPPVTERNSVTRRGGGRRRTPSGRGFECSPGRGAGGRTSRATRRRCRPR